MVGTLWKKIRLAAIRRDFSFSTRIARLAKIRDGAMRERP